jgi:nicotinamidase/pyrazinamidase
MPDYGRATALIVVDVQNDFAEPDGSLYVNGAEDLIPAINREIERAVESGALVVYSRDYHPERTPHFQIDGGVWPVHCVGGSHGADFHPELEVVPGAPQVLKGTGGEDGYSAFSLRDPTSGEIAATELADLLEERNISDVVIVGLATDYCVKETALDARELGFGVTVLRSGIGAVDLQPGDGDRALAAIEAAGGRVE